MMKSNGSRRKLALLIGINKYKNSAEIPTLDGCINDVEAMKKVLTSSRYGFAPEDVIVLRDKDATRANIIKQFKEHLVNNVTSDSIVVFHYSGHGSRMKDPADPLGYDNTILPYDTRDSRNKVTDIRDKELNALLQLLAAKTTNITCILDSCFSGTGFRAAGKQRRAPDDGRFGDHPPAPETFGERVRARDAGSPSGFPDRDVDYVLIAGCRADQHAFEVHDNNSQSFGALTYYLVRELLRPVRGLRTYRELIASVAPEIQAAFPSQTPQLEGKDIDKVVFGNQKINEQPYFVVAPSENSLVSLNGGRLYGFTVGSVFDLFSLEDHFATNRLEQVILSKVDDLVSIGKLTGLSSIVLPCKAIEREHNFEGQQTQIFLEDWQKSPNLKRLRTTLSNRPSTPFVFVDDASYFQIRLIVENNRVHMFGPDGNELAAPVPANEADIDEILETRCLRWARWFRIAGLQNPAASSVVAFTFIPHEATEPAVPGRKVIFPQGEDRFDTKVKNLGNKTLNIYILDLTSVGKISPVYPELNATVPLEPQHELVISNWNVALPTGQTNCVHDIFKLIATSSEINVNVFQQDAPRGVDTAKLRAVPPTDPLDHILFDAAIGRRDAYRRVPVDWTTAEISFDVCR